MSDKCVVMRGENVVKLDDTRKDLLAIAMLCDSPLAISVATRMTTLSHDEEGNASRIANPARVDFVNLFAKAGTPSDEFTVILTGSKAGKERVTRVTMTRRAIAERLLIAARFDDLKPLAKVVTQEGKEVVSKSEDSEGAELTLEGLE